MAKKPISVVVDEEVHSRVKSAAPLRGCGIADAYDQALRQWLGDTTHGETDASPAESPYIDAVLYMLRSSDPDKREMVKAVLKPGLGKLIKPARKEKRSAA